MQGLLEITFLPPSPRHSWTFCVLATGVDKHALGVLLHFPLSNLDSTSYYVDINTNLDQFSVLALGGVLILATSGIHQLKIHTDILNRIRAVFTGCIRGIARLARLLHHSSREVVRGGSVVLEEGFPLGSR